MAQLRILLWLFVYLGRRVRLALRRAMRPTPPAPPPLEVTDRFMSVRRARVTEVRGG